MNNIKTEIKADADCRFCGGSGYATHFITGNKVVCQCIRDKIKVLTAED